MNERNKDNVNHPFHYEGSTSIECIQAMHLAFGDIGACYFCLCNAFKYVWRYKNKNGKEDLDKAQWYLDHVSDTFARRYIESPEIHKMYERMSNLLHEVKDSK